MVKVTWKGWKGSSNGEIARSLRVSDGQEFEAFLQGLFDTTKRTT